MGNSIGRAVLFGVVTVAAISNASDFNLMPFQINLSAGVPRMLEFINDTILPAQPAYPGLGDSLGIDLDVVKSLKEQWLDEFDWDAEQRDMNQLPQYTAEIEGHTIHFVHAKSRDPDAIPLLINHGWPGSSFLEFEPIIDKLTTVVHTSHSGRDKKVSFDVIIPSLPGFAFSSPAPKNWTLDDTARLYNRLMTEVLGYPKFAVHGTSHGAAIAYTLYEDYTNTTRAAHFSFIPFFPPTGEQVKAMNISLTPLEKDMLNRSDEWSKTGSAYFLLQQYQPNTIGLALQDNPIGLLSWIGEKYIEWSNPNAGTPPSLLTHNEILRCVSLYFLTKSFITSIFTYAQNPTAFRSFYTKAPTTAPMLLSQFKYNVGYWPRQIAESVGNLVEYRNHESGGNFPGLDNPEALISDIRRIGEYWT
ncbi:unnamed protein product [Clonostachys solani]|uniref:Epoxide hydrolase N-terminal domain-containing protein n=1 Tax=Clonostachys solani TaxID=160281 RepID=A0A9N9Z9M8_9HYPO|nr:unnamed protein product [Clonostachys solani]